MKIYIRAAENKQRGRQFDMSALTSIIKTYQFNVTKLHKNKLDEHKGMLRAAL